MTIKEAAATDTASALAPKLAELAAHIVGSLTETHYTHTIHIDAPAGVFDVDCSGFVSYLLEQVADRHYQMVAASSPDPRPAGARLLRLCRLPGAFD